LGASRIVADGLEIDGTDRVISPPVASSPGPTCAVDLKIWGKSKGFDSPYPLLAHLVDTAAFAYSLLSEHLSRNTARTLGLDNDEAIRRFAFLAGLHDLGKSTPAFQRQRPESREALTASGYLFPAGNPVYHDRATQLTLPETIESASRSTALTGSLGAACMLGGHHGIFHQLKPMELSPSGRLQISLREPQLGGGPWEIQRLQHVRELALAVGVPTALPDLGGHQLVMGAGVVVIADWLASQESVIGPSSFWPDWEQVDWAMQFDVKVEQASRSIREAGLSAPRVVSRTFSETFGFEPRSLQVSIEESFVQGEVKPGILVITAPMGVGKTEAALLASPRMGGDDSGVLFLLPTMATTDAMFDRVVGYAKRVAEGNTAEVSLIHSMAALNPAYSTLPQMQDDVTVSDDDETVAISSQWLRGRQRTLLAPIAAGTIDQLLAASLRSKRGFLRWLGVSGKTVIIDEAHSFDAYMHGLFVTALEWLGRFNIPVIVMSATLPGRVAEELVAAWCRGAQVAAPTEPCPYPGWQFMGRDGSHVIKQIPAEPSRIEVTSVMVKNWPSRWKSAVIERLMPVVDDGCALVVCNTVAEAQDLAGSLQVWATSNDIELLCLHSRFTQSDRRHLTDEVLRKFGPDGKSRPRKAVLIATQIVEQSLDVDFDLVISCLAPVANLLQRAGRGHRHPRDERPDLLNRPTLEVLVPVGTADALSCPKAWSFIYPNVYLERTWALALGGGSANHWVLPDDVQAMVDEVYGDLSTAGEDDELIGQMDREWLEARANSEARIPTPDALASLAELTSSFDEELLLATRLGISSELVICLWRGNGELYLDREMQHPLPSSVDVASVRAILGASIPLSSTARATQPIVGASEAPPAWAESAWLADAKVLVLNPSNADALIGSWKFTLDPLVGLRSERMS